MRLKQIQEAIKQREIDAILVTSPYNLRYVSHFTGTTGLAVITTKSAYFVTDARYTEQAAKQCVGFEIIQNFGSILLEVKKLVSDLGIQKLGFEDGYVSVSQFNELEQLTSASLVGVTGLIESLRELKDASEFEIIRQANAIADKAFDYILGEIKPGVTEIEIANKLDFYMRSLGASGVSFETIVASGARSAMPHGVASHKVIEKGDFITMDYGCYFNGYVSDMTRTISLGEPRHQQLREIHDIVLNAQLLVNENVKAVMTGSQVDKIARDYITKHGYGEFFVHSTGHGIGLEIHEAPGLNRSSETILKPGHAITNEPGIYLPGIGGVRIEDDLFITENGVEIITKSDKSLIIL